MSSGRLFSHWPRPSPWTCSRCLRKQIQALPQQHQKYSSHANDIRRPRRRPILLVFSSVVALTAGAIAFSDTGKYGYRAAQRTGSVLGTLLICINDYRKTLRQRDVQEEEDYAVTLKACHKRCANRVLATMEKNGSIFIKLGQHLSSLNYLLPREWCDTFIPLQDHCPVSSFQSIKRMVEGDTGMAFADIFSDFQEQPLGAASLAQVHRAIDKGTGQRVAVKCQHPTLDDWAPLDIALTRFTFSMVKRAFPDYDLTWLSDEMEVSLPQELNFELEGQNAIRARAYFEPLKDIPLVIPRVLWAKRRVLVMEYMTGHRPDDLPYLDSHSISRDEVSAALARIFNTMIFAPNAPLHCDPHGGNIAVRVNHSRRPPHNFDIILYDHGLYRSIPLELQRNYAKLWLAVLDTDEGNMRKYAREVAGITDEQFPLFATVITGREYRAVTRNVSRVPRTDEEKRAMSNALQQEGLLQQIVNLLGKIPRIILLILKTNDLNANLHTRQGPLRSFLILARYAGQTVYEEQLESLRSKGSLLWPPGNARRFFMAWTQYARVEFKLQLYEWYLHLRGLLGLKNEVPTAIGTS